MDVSLIGRALAHSKLVVVLGVLIAVVGGFFAGFSVGSGGVSPRVPPTYTASETILLTNPNLSIYAAQVGAGGDGANVPQNANLSQLALLYAWVISGDEIRDRTVAEIGALGPGEDLTAVRRTTQPTGSERFGANNSLPILDIVATATSSQRASAIASAASGVFLDYLAQQQADQNLSDADRVEASVLRSPQVELVDGGSSITSAVLVGVVILLAILAVAVYRYNTQVVRGARSGSHRDDDSAAPPVVVQKNRPPVTPAGGVPGPWDRTADPSAEGAVGARVP